MNTQSIPDRARAYVAKIPPAVSGQRGHDQTFSVACALVNGFALGESDALTILSEYNATCSPPWADAELEHKIKSAMAAPHNKPTGHLIGEHHPVTAQPIRAKLTPEQRKRQEEQENLTRLAAKARAAQKQILAQFACGFAQYGNGSPVNLLNGDPRNDWRLMLKLYAPDDVLWIGTKKNESANESHGAEWIDYCKTRFRTVTEWLKETTCPGILITPATFKPGSFSRCDDNIVSRPFLVVESDLLNRIEVCAVFKWMEQFAKLRAIVDTGGKSLHGWFEMPSPEIVAQLETILPNLGCDKALFAKSQPVRLPGGLRPETNIVQSLLYLDV